MCVDTYTAFVLLSGALSGSPLPPTAQRPHSAYYHSALVPWLPSLAESTEDYDREMDDYTQEDAERLRLLRAVCSYHYSPTLALPMMEHTPTDRVRQSALSDL